MTALPHLGYGSARLVPGPERRPGKCINLRLPIWCMPPYDHEMSPPKSRSCSYGDDYLGTDVQKIAARTNSGHGMSSALNIMICWDDYATKKLQRVLILSISGERSAAISRHTWQRSLVPTASDSACPLRIECTKRKQRCPCQSTSKTRRLFTVITSIRR